MKIALTGNPNSGKTTMFNALTARNERVGNWAGVTVEKKECRVRRKYQKNGVEITAIDLPGAYSISPFTSDESITGDYVKNQNPDVIINIVDATNLSRSLFFTTQLLELNIPTVIALNKSDINTRRHTEIDSKLLSELLGCRVVDTISTSAKGLHEVIAAAKEAVGKKWSAPYKESRVLLNKAEAAAADRRRYEYVNTVVSMVERREDKKSGKSFGDRVDEIITNKWVGIPIFAIIMYAVFWISQSGPAVWLADALVGLLQSGQQFLSQSIGGTDSLINTLLIDGIIGGVIAVVGFLPLIMVMYFLIALLEDCGYMARATVVLDPIFKRVGLSGKSVIPFIIGTGCAVPGVMACRTIRDERERRATSLLAPFMPCGAKLPVISLFSGAFFKGSAWVGATMYFVGIAIIFLSALLINKLTGAKRRRSFFIIELPDYKAPSIINAVFSMCRRGISYIVKAGTVILVCNFAVRLMQKFDWSFNIVAEDATHTSILAIIASPFAYLLAPIIGVVAWQLAAASVTGFIAKENIVGTLSVCFSMSNLFNLDELSMLEGAESIVAANFDITSVAALAFLMFNLFSPPCSAAIGAMNSELKSKKWLFAGVILQLAVGYTVGFLVFFLGSLIVGSELGEPWMVILGLCIILLNIFVVTILIARKNRQLKKEAAAMHSATI